MPRLRLFSLLFVGSLIIATVSCQGQSPKLSVTRDWWPGGILQREARYTAAVFARGLNDVEVRIFQPIRLLNVAHVV